MAHTGDTVAVRGLAELRRGLKKAEDGIDKEFAKALRAIGDPVLRSARSDAPVGPRPKRSSTPPLADSLRLSVTRGKVSVFSNAAHAGVIDGGGRVGHGATITPARYMTRAITSNRGAVERSLNELLDTLDSTVTNS